MFEIQSLGVLGLIAVYLGTILEGEAVLLVGALLIEKGTFTASQVMIAAYPGAVTGDLFCFWMGRRHGRFLLKRWPRLESRVLYVATLLQKHRVFVILGFRFIYGMRSVVPVALGMSRIDTTLFVLLDLCAASVWTLGILFLGRIFVTSVGLSYLLDRYRLVVLGGLFLGLFLWIFWRYAGKRIHASLRQREAR
ncbi:DedA family protein [Desulfoplanes sp.]